MSKVKVYLKDTFMQQLELDPNREYFAGRGESCEILLNPEKGISRQHFKLRFKDGQWGVEVLSKIGEVYFLGQRAMDFNLQSGERFDAPPYNFIFLDDEDSIVRSNTNVTSAGMQSESKMSQFSLAPDEEKTFVGNLPQIALLKMTDPLRPGQQIFRLEGEAWVAGRDFTCNLFIDHAHLSRRQFEIQKNDGQFCIINLSTVNKTMLNGSEVPTDQWTVMSSGDVISIVDIDIAFELRDALFDKKMQGISPDLLSPVIFDEASLEKSQILQPKFFEVPQPGRNSINAKKFLENTNSNPAIQQQGQAWSENSKKKKSIPIVRIAIGACVMLVLMIFIFSDDEPAKKAKSDAGTMAKNYDPKFDKLTPEQKNYVRDSYRLADSLFRQGKYEMARQETTKIHQLVANYEESKNIEKLAEVAIQTQIDKNRAEVREQEKRQSEEKIVQQVAFCRTKVSNVTEMEDIELCLSSVMSLNPEHPSIITFKNEVDRMISIREIRQSEKEEYQQRVARQKALFEKAQRIVRTLDYIQSVKALQDVMEARLPDPKGYKIQASRQIASIKTEMNQKLSVYLKDSETFKQKGNLKSAILELRKAKTIDPESRDLAKKEKQYISELKKQMQVLYQEGILEESVGEVETAKVKWKKILSSSVPDEEYYIKANIKLKKYEAN